MERVVEIDYMNWRGERRWRPIRPLAIVFATTKFHPEPQWLVEAWDVELSHAMPKFFAMKDIHGWRPLGEP